MEVEERDSIRREWFLGIAGGRHGGGLWILKLISKTVAVNFTRVISGSQSGVGELAGY